MKVGFDLDLDLAGRWLATFGVIAWVVGLVYGTPETVDILDPMIVQTKDGQLLFMQAHGATIAYGGIGAMLLGTLILVWRNGGIRIPRLRKKRNRFTCCKWQRRALS